MKTAFQADIYPVGYDFYVARVFKEYHNESILVAGEQYTRQVTRYMPIVKKKVITKVTITMRPFGNEFNYHAAEETPYPKIETGSMFSRQYTETDIGQFTCWEEAWAFAKWKAVENKEYFGQ